MGPLVPGWPAFRWRRGACRRSSPPLTRAQIHGRVINPAGVPQKDGTVSLSVDGGVTLSYNFPVSSSGDYSGQAPPGEYTLVYRAPDTPEGKIVDYISGVQVDRRAGYSPGHRYDAPGIRRQALAGPATAIAGVERGERRVSLRRQPRGSFHRCRPANCESRFPGRGECARRLQPGTWPRRGAMRTSMQWPQKSKMPSCRKSKP